MKNYVLKSKINSNSLFIKHVNDGEMRCLHGKVVGTNENIFGVFDI